MEAKLKIEENLVYLALSRHASAHSTGMYDTYVYDMFYELRYII
jgi:hypothetical protein